MQEIMPHSLFQHIQKIHVQTARLAKDLLSGLYRSAFKGKGMEFEEVREYQPGDEFRNIDWSVTSRMNHPYVKVFREERELTIMLVIDCSASTLVGSGKRQKKDMIAEMSAALAFSALKNNDKIGLILFSDTIELYLPPDKSSKHVLRIIRELLAYEPSHASTNVSKALSFLGKIQPKSCVCFLISDFLVDDFQKELSLAAVKHDLIAVCVSDPIEFDPPDIGLTTFLEAETENLLIIDLSNQKNRDALKQNFKNHINHTSKVIHKVGADFLEVYTHKPYIPILQNFFKKRGSYPK